MKIPFLLFFLICNSLIGFGQETAKEIVNKADQKFRGDTQFAEMTMTIVRPDWKRSMSLKSWLKGEDYSLVLVTAPAKDKGTVSLKRMKDLWNWMPAIERSIKVSPSMMNQSWMGSDFTNDDLMKQSSIVVDYDHSFEGSETINGYECHKIKLVPKPDAPVVWGKIYMWISKEEYFQMKSEFYDEDEFLINTMTSSGVKQMGDREIPTKLVMQPEDKPGNQTIITYQKIEYNQPIAESFFSLQNMKKVR
ncbi:outer membrane lipoprotein-sorting protein [Flexithrix dorotheae]|uniref:outer membrane lipoprotein-sorting protein n=1 Tax=Flexithrix dorotheae TaxID=70993 RepID=UPI000381CE78|nr:outer membrane lipoprotein-sorting protein [Flexithrix dorotheae]